MNQSASGCPVDHEKIQKEQRKDGTGCPVDHSKFSKHHKGFTTPNDDTLNPHNMMPKNLSQEMAEGQTQPLSTERTVSGIPKSAENDKWEYPSPQQFYNALKRKGKEAPAENIDMMVDIHNFLNEACWQEIVKWEQRFHCDCKNLRLIKFQGRPDELSPKAWFYTNFRGADKPFDRHDWTIDRCGTDVRYVIDYYSGHNDGENPSFNVDVRPALDSPSSIWDRTRAGASSLWNKLFNSFQ